MRIAATILLVALAAAQTMPAAAGQPDRLSDHDPIRVDLPFEEPGLPRTDAGSR